MQTSFVISIPKDQNDQGPQHPGHMGGDTLGCRVGCSGVQIYIMIKSKIQNQYGMDALDVITEYLFAEVSWQIRHPVSNDSPVPPIIPHYEQAEMSTDRAAGWAKPTKPLTDAKYVSWRSSGTTAPMEVTVVLIERARQDLSIGTTFSSVGATVHQ